jgi:hypothetical protein
MESDNRDGECEGYSICLARRTNHPRDQRRELRLSMRPGLSEYRLQLRSRRSDANAMSFGDD